MAVGQGLLDGLVLFAGLRPDQRVLEVGCGNGRLAVPLTTFLADGGSYVGTDVVRSGIRWCRRAIASRFANFEFMHVDVRHPLYRPRGRGGEAASFPFGDDSFDVVVLTSVFTHLLPQETVGMLEQAARVLRSGGVLFSTWFVPDLDEVVPDADYAFERVDAVHAVGRRDVPHARVAYDEGWVRDRMIEAGFERVDEMHPGAWRNAGGGPLYHDAFVARMPSDA